MRQFRQSGRFSLEILLTVTASLVTIIAACAIFYDLGAIVVEQYGAGRYWNILLPTVLAAVVIFLIYGSLVYFLTRIGWLERQEAHTNPTINNFYSIYDRDTPSLSVLVPSYKEDERVVCQTLLSAALMEYPNKRVVLLIDDPPEPNTDADARALAHMRRLPARLQAMLAEVNKELQDHLSSFLERRNRGSFVSSYEAHNLARLYERSAGCLEKWGDQWGAHSHVDAFFIDRVFREPASRHRARSAYLQQIASTDCPTLDDQKAGREYRRLAGLFNVEFSSFERKQFTNLSHEANKAMNLNSYLTLMGKAWRINGNINERYLEECSADEADLLVSSADFVITLDADSILLNSYALQLTAVMEKRGNEKLAVIQTPYSAFPGARSTLERIAGATTDIQYLVHQGFTRFNGTFWVGANALIRRRALDDIAFQRDEHDPLTAIYIQDRTVIEDTESTVDLIAKGWTLYNYPNRLAYSATPGDFGSLLIQRRRWANGGLIILPKLMRHILARPRRGATVIEAFVRIHYLISPATTSLGIFALFLLPFEPGLRSIWLPLAAAPYFLLYGRDLVRTGYAWSDLPRVYALNLLLVPVNLGGVMKSLHQALTGHKTPFGRTPKVDSRTAAPPLYVIGVVGLLALSLVSAIGGLIGQFWASFWFSSLNAVVFSYVIIRFIGLRESLEDGLVHCPRLQRRMLNALDDQWRPRAAGVPKLKMVKARQVDIAKRIASEDMDGR